MDCEVRSLSTRDGAESRWRQLKACEQVLSSWIKKWTDLFPSHEVTQTQILTYIEALDDLTPEQINIGCREATRTAEQFPKPGHIRKAYLQSNDEQRHERPDYLDEIPSEEEQTARAQWREYYRRLEVTKLVEAPKIPRQFLPVRSIQAQKAALREKGFLK